MLVYAIPDIHFPYVDKKALKKVLNAIRDEKPDVVIQMGDLYDQYVFGRFDRNLNEISPDEEMSRGRKMAVNFWRTIKKHVPEARCIQLSGNHDMRMLKTIISKAPEYLGMVEKARDKMYSFDGVETFNSDRDFVEIDGVVYVHGWKQKVWDHYVHFNKPVVRCHSHRAELRSLQNRSTDYKFAFEMACGCLVDESSVPFNYTTSKMNNWEKAFGVIVDGRPWLEYL